VKADQQLRGGVSKPVELNAPLDGRKPETSRIRNKKSLVLSKTLSKKVDLSPSFEEVVHRATRCIKTEGPMTGAPKPLQQRLLG